VLPNTKRLSAPGTPLRLARIAAIVFLVGVPCLIGLVGAASAWTQRIALVVKDVHLDSQTGFVNGLRVEASNMTSKPKTLRFAVTTGFGFAFWEPSRVEVPAHVSVDVQLSPGDLSAEVPYARGRSFQVIAFAPQEGLAAYAWATRRVSGSYGVRNGRLLSAINKFQMLTLKAPLGWHMDPAPLLEGAIQIVPDGPFGRAVRFKVTSPARVEWHIAQMTQPIVMDGPRFTFWLKPSQSDMGQRFPLQTFGIAINDSQGRQTYFVVDSHIKKMAWVVRDRDAYYFLPGGVRVWNRYTVDLAHLPVFAQEPNSPLTVVVMDAVHRDYHGTAGGEFGGILESGDKRFPARTSSPATLIPPW
jgi:hypothetical protein